MSAPGCTASPSVVDGSPLISNDRSAWAILGPAQGWTKLASDERGAFEFYAGELARQPAFTSDSEVGDSAMEILFPTSGSDVPVDIAHFGRGKRPWFSEVKVGLFEYFGGTRFFGSKRLLREGVAKPRSFYLLSSPSGTLGILPAALRDVRKLGFAKPITFNCEWWEGFY